MGLSNEERTTKMTWAVHYLTAAARKLPPGYNTVKTPCDRLWHALLGKVSNPTHWVFGSSADNPIGGAASPWSIALEGYFEDDRNREPPTERTKEHNDYYKDPKADMPYDLERDILRMVNLHALLALPDDKGLDTVYEIYARTEDISYALRRYNDDYRRSFADLDTLVSDIQGACFSIFATHEDYARAYLLDQILTHGIYTDACPIKQHALRHNWHHHLSRPMTADTPLKTLRQWHLRITNGLNPTGWVTLALEIMGHHYHYEHQYKELLADAKTRKIPLDTKKTRAAFDRNVKAHKTHEANQHKAYGRNQTYDHLSAIHGHDVAYKHWHK